MVDTTHARQTFKLSHFNIFYNNKFHIMVRFLSKLFNFHNHNYLIWSFISNFQVLLTEKWMVLLVFILYNDERLVDITLACSASPPHLHNFSQPSNFEILYCQLFNCSASLPTQPSNFYILKHSIFSFLVTTQMLWSSCFMKSLPKSNWVTCLQTFIQDWT